jgi:hypothetical protein
MFSFLIVIAAIGLIMAPKARSMFFGTLSGVLRWIVWVLTVIWLAGSRPARRWW